MSGAKAASRIPLSYVAVLVPVMGALNVVGGTINNALKLPMKAVLVSPHFLYRIEEDIRGQSADARRAARRGPLTPQAAPRGRRPARAGATRRAPRPARAGRRETGS